MNAFSPDEDELGTDPHYPTVELGKKFGVKIPIYINRDDRASELRSMLNVVGQQVARSMMQTWLANPDDYNVDIVITMEAKK